VVGRLTWWRGILQMWDEVKDHLPAVLYAGIEREFSPWIRED
jgi:hypothetical protein